MILTRRSFLGGLGLALAAPVIVRAASLMHVRALPFDENGFMRMIWNGNILVDVEPVSIFVRLHTIDPGQLPELEYLDYQRRRIAV